MYIHSVRLAEWAGGIAGLAMYRSMTAVAAGSLIGRVASTTLLTLWAARAFPQFRWRFREASRAQVRELLPSAAAFLALPIGNAMLFQGVTIAVGTGFGPAALALFNTCRTLSRIPVQLLTTFSRSLWPEMSRSFGAGDVASLGRIYHRSARVSIVVCALACAVLFAASPTILRYWSQGRLQADMPLIALLCIGSLAGCAWQIDQVLLSATNTHLRLSLWYFLSALLVVALVCIVPRQFGMDGVAILLIVFELAMLLVSRRMVGLPLRGAVA
jgi:O-antigen/teichoic acid export membrane protein